MPHGPAGPGLGMQQVVGQMLQLHMHGRTAVRITPVNKTDQHGS